MITTVFYSIILSEETRKSRLHLLILGALRIIKELNIWDINYSIRLSHK